MDDSFEASFAVGIDLGTTNTALSAVPLGVEDAVPGVFPLPQVVQPGELREEPLLPSFLYLPADAELPPGSIDLPWYPNARAVVGRFARDRGAGSPARLVSSAKSWLSHAGVDRRAAILPWGAPGEVPRVSPLEASARYLAHVVAAWDEAHPDHPLYDQDVVLTVPASFDAVARELTAEAAQLAGLGENLRLLEEPQAALYAWLADRGPRWRDDVTVGDVILVCDIGGGTTDFSLIAVTSDSGSLELERVAVGDHILLGGDNMDLALAYTVRRRMEADGNALDDWQMRALTHGCRAGKEALFGDASLDAWPLVVPGRGSRLIGGTLRTELTREELTRVLLDGFFPVVGSDARPQAPRRLGLTSLGLPYAHDAGMTRHLAAFLGREGLDRRVPGRSLVHPTAVLFNGGVTRSPLIRDRIMDVLTAWCVDDGGQAPKVLDGDQPDLAVSRGAAWYARVRREGGLRIRGGTARSYYVGVERAELAVPGIPPQVDALCIAPFGMEEGSEVTLPELFGLFVGEPAAFQFFGSSTRRSDEVGTVVDPRELEELSPIETTLAGEDTGVVPVRLHARVTEVGTLDLSAVAEADARRWRLSFNVRVE
ncbi:MAG: Hsp70 family protein [Myxococcales bacterium]|nr:Hsp70 family protein [Myxococcales bacterium]MCB9549089.1 Hsp70 family protein [Myxococcales bacterium]